MLRNPRTEKGGPKAPLGGFKKKILQSQWCDLPARCQHENLLMKLTMGKADGWGQSTVTDGMAEEWPPAKCDSVAALQARVLTPLRATSIG
jgi:hypothetical protein